MADKFTFRTGSELLRAFPVGSGVVIDIGDHLTLTAGKMVPVANTTDNLIFIGVAKEAHRAVDPSGEITVAVRNANGIYEVDLDSSTTIVVGDFLASDGTNQDLTKNATDPIAIAMESKVSADSIRCIYTLPATTAGLNFIGDAA